MASVNDAAPMSGLSADGIYPVRSNHPSAESKCLLLFAASSKNVWANEFFVLSTVPVS